MYLVPLWALFSAVRSRMGWALLSSKLWPSGLSEALLPGYSSFWRCQVTRICTPWLGPRPRNRYWIVPSHQIQSPVWWLPKGCWTFAPFSKSGYASGWGGASGGRGDDEDAWSGFAGRVGGGAGGWKVVALPSFLACLGAGGGCTSFLSRSLGWDWRWWGLRGVGLEEGVRSLLAPVP